MLSQKACGNFFTIKLKYISSFRIPRLESRTLNDAVLVSASTNYLLEKNENSAPNYVNLFAGTHQKQETKSRKSFAFRDKAQHILCFDEGTRKKKHKTCHAKSLFICVQNASSSRKAAVSLFLSKNHESAIFTLGTRREEFADFVA